MTTKTIWLEGASRREYNGELSYVDSQADHASTTALLCDGLWFPAIGVVTQVQQGKRLVDGDSLQYDDLWDLVKNPRAVLVGAWDEMNYLLWTPNTQ